MKTQNRTSTFLAMLFVVPMLQGCSKAKYQQIPGQPKMQVQQAPQPPAPAPVPVRPSGDLNGSSISQSERITPERDQTGEEGPLPKPTATPGLVLERVNPVRTGAAPDTSWMDPTRYPRAGGSQAPVVQPAPVAAKPCPPVPQPVAAKPQLPAPTPLPPAVPAPVVAKPAPKPVKPPCNNCNAKPLAPPPIPVLPPTAAPKLAPKTPCPTCRHETWTQNQAPLADKMDITFVVDTSDSIFKEREAAAQNIERLVSELPEGLDVHIGVILAHSSTTQDAKGHSRNGELYQSTSGEPIVIKSTEMSRDQMREALRAKLTQPPGDRGSDGGELGLYSLMAAIRDTKANYNGNKGVRAANLGMFRADAAQTVIFLADENDICSRGQYPKGVTPKADPNNAEVPAFKRYCTGITAQSVYTELMGHRSPGLTTYQNASKETIVKPVLIAAMVYVNPATVPARNPGDKYASENEVGYGYLDMVRINGGVAIDLANIDITKALTRIGQAAHQKIQKPVTHLITDEKKFDPNTVCVLIDDQEVGYTTDRKENYDRLTARGIARPGAKVEFFYCLDDGNRSADRYSQVQVDPRCKSLRARMNK